MSPFIAVTGTTETQARRRDGTCREVPPLASRSLLPYSPEGGRERTGQAETDRDAARRVKGGFSRAVEFPTWL